jgi:outer membrane murein-binding lipoprotein Lpp
MNAVMHRSDLTEGADMPESEDNNLAIQVAELRSDVRHIQSDVTNVKADMRALRKETGERYDKIEQKFDSKFESLDQTLWSAKIWALGLYCALAGSLLLVLARGFKWI